jgi:hypothetical protein
MLFNNKLYNSESFEDKKVESEPNYQNISDQFNNDLPKSMLSDCVLSKGNLYKNV